MIHVIEGKPYLRPCAHIPSDGNEQNDWFVSMAELHEPLTTLMPMAGGAMLGQAHDGEPRLTSRLRDEAPWLETLIDRIADQCRISLWAGQPWLRMAPVLLVGPPGAGKTHFARRLGEIAGCGSGVLGLAGVSSTAELGGNPRGYRHAQPCFPACVMSRTHTGNPIMVIDEVDKVARHSSNGDATATLLSMLEPASAERYFDGCLAAEIDISHVSWILTANSLETLPAPLLSRVEVIEVKGPEPEHASMLLATLWRRTAKRLGVSPADLPPLDPKVEAKLLDLFRTTGSVRRLAKVLETLVAIGIREHKRSTH